MPNNLIAKRAFDIFAASLGLLILSPVIVFLAFLVKRESPGPVFYRGSRLGWNGKSFGILKFRTMREDAATYSGPRLTAKGDERITKVGRWLRATKLNELPQLWNVLMGEMSLVGPRPEDPEFAAVWPEDARQEILSVRPGITSPASILYLDEESRLSQENLVNDYLENIVPDKLRLDRLYVRHRSFTSDLDIIFWTLIMLVPRFTKPELEGRLFSGFITRAVSPVLSWTLIDFGISFFAAGLVSVIWRAFAPINIGLELALPVAVLYAFSFGVLNTILGLKNIEWSRASAQDSYIFLLSCLMMITAGSLLDLAIPSVKVENGYIILVSLTATLGFIIARYRFRLITGFASRWVRASGKGLGERVLVVGAGSAGEIATWLLRRPDLRFRFNMVGYVDDSSYKQGMRFDGFRVIGTTGDIPTLVKKQDIGLVVFAIENISIQDRQRLLDSCNKSGARIVLLADILQSLETLFFQRVEPDNLKVI